MASEPYPVDSSIKVLDGTTISKDNGFWTAVLLIEGYNKKIQVKLYMWVWGKDRQTGQERWVRKQNFTVGAKSWPAVKEATEKYLQSRYQMIPKRTYPPRQGGSYSTPQPPSSPQNAESESPEPF
jgi:hypothetical protein